MNALQSLIRPHVLFAVAVVLVGTGILVGIGAVRNVSDARETVKTQALWTQEMFALASEARQVDTRQAAIGAMTEARIVPLQDLLQETLDEFLPSEMRNLKVPAIEGWTVHRKELSFETVPLPALMRFIKAAERLDTPWRLERIQIFSSSVKPGYARVILTMRAASQQKR